MVPEVFFAFNPTNRILHGSGLERFLRPVCAVSQNGGILHPFWNPKLPVPGVRVWIHPWIADISVFSCIAVNGDIVSFDRMCRKSSLVMGLSVIIQMEKGTTPSG